MKAFSLRLNGRDPLPLITWLLVIQIFHFQLLNPPYKSPRIDSGHQYHFRFSVINLSLFLSFFVQFFFRFRFLVNSRRKMKCLLLLGLLACVLAVVCASSYNYAQAARGGRRSSSRRLSPARAAPAAEGGDEAEPAPEPYNFSYTSETDDGSKQVTFGPKISL